MTIFSLQSLKIAVDGGDEAGLLVLHGDILVAVLVCLAQPIYNSDQDHWYLETGFGKCAGQPGTFPKLQTALRWIAERLEVDPTEATACAQQYLDRADGHAIH